MLLDRSLQTRAVKAQDDIAGYICHWYTLEVATYFVEKLFVCLSVFFDIFFDIRYV